jgi:hypothetical protein
VNSRRGRTLEVDIVIDDTSIHAGSSVSFIDRASFFL